MKERSGIETHPHTVGSDKPFFGVMVALGSVYVLLVGAMLVADASFTTWDHIADALSRKEIRYAIWFSLLSCTLTTILALWAAIPIGYLLARFEFPGRGFLNALVDVPIVLPPLVIGISLLILFNTAPGRAFEDGVTPITYAIPSVIIAQFAVACAFAVRAMVSAFERTDPRREQVALTLGCTRSQAFFSVVLPEARSGVIAAAMLAWARALGEFGPILVFSGATRMKTEVLPTSVFLELSIGNVEAAVAISLLMVTMAVVVLLVTRWLGVRHIGS
ncbi:MAG: molybdenum ABC transporter permease [Planctomycetes bacterium]|nr:molybdenum ABC transporter permease [Planctomycetota bacterium]